MIKSPYNFVPLSEHVFSPEWKDQISHDVPFSDGESGEIDVTITADTPLYIREGGLWNADDRTNRDSKMHNFFSDNKGNCVIPGTSLKGVIRNVFEIITYSKMQFVENNRYSIRNLRNSIYTKKMTKTEGDWKNKTIRPLVKSGWLTILENKWCIIPCEYARVEIKDLKNFHSNNPSIENKQSSVSKYNKWGDQLAIDFDTKKGPFAHSCGMMDYIKAINIRKGDKGKIVFTGQASPRKMSKFGKMFGKHMEFVFFNENENNCKNVENLKKDFIFIHSDGKGNPNEEWKYWKGELKKTKRVPVFYLEKNNKVHSMGLAMMYRLAYDYSVHEVISNTNSNHLKSDDIDFAEAIFGRSKDPMLKGRVQVGHFKETLESKNKRNDISCDCVTTVLGSPKPTYYPNYIEQEHTKIIKGKRQYNTFMDSNSKIRGWKRYPIQDNNCKLDLLPKPPKNSMGRTNMDVATLFKPLPKGTEFKGKLRYHNLKLVELGAIIWSLTFGGNTNCRHSIGMAKPYGLGSIKLSIKDNDKYRNSLEKFINYMDDKLNGKLIEQDEVKELLLMADIKVKSNNELKYQIMDNTRRINDFVDDEKKNFYLERYSKSINSKKKPSAKTPKKHTNTPPQKTFISEVLQNIERMNAKNLRKLLISLIEAKQLKEQDIISIEHLINKRADRKQISNQKVTQYLKAFEELKNNIKKEL